MLEELITNDRGRPAAKINMQLAVFMTNQLYHAMMQGYFFLPLKFHLYQKQVNYVSPKWRERNEEMMDDKSKILKILKHDKDECSSSVTCMTDTCYNNPTKGICMYQPDTKSVTPMLEECVTSPL